MGVSIKTAATVQGVITGVGLPEIDSMIVHCAAGGVGPSGLSAGKLHIDMPPREEQTGRQNLPQNAKD